MKIDVLLEPDQTPDQLVELAQLCELAGIHTMWLQNYLSSRDAFLSLVPAVLATRKVGLGVCIVSSYEMHPVKMANALYTLNEYAKGRARLVIGGGGEWLLRLGMTTDKRITAVRESIEMVKQSSADKPLAYQGKVFKVYGFQPKYATAAAPLVYAGANREHMLRGTVAAGDGVMYSDMPRGLVQKMTDTVREALQTANRPIDGYRINNIWAWHIKPDRETALREARRELLLRGWLDPWYIESFLSADESDFITRNKSAFYKAYRDRTGVIDGMPEELVNRLIDNFTLTGTVDELEGKLPELDAFGAAGVNEICFRLHDNPAEAIKLIGKHVVPSVGRDLFNKPPASAAPCRYPAAARWCGIRSGLA
jgi:alkanesulfonate monooxygenase SsuD/methylene tetrahydromethanopterin reductase-like flavin-dependent oxidoreductase (luciferase family)